jgi:hypothetical protein
MKTSRCYIIALISLGSAAAALTAAPAQRSAPTFELPRLKARANPADSSAITRTKATVDDLSTQGKSNVHSVASGRLRYLTIDGGTSWSRGLRGGPKETTFVSFFVYGSDGTVLDVAGAKLQIRNGGKPGYAQLQVGKTTASGVQWRNFGGLVKFETHGGRTLAALPVLTVRHDRPGKTWDLYLSNRLVLMDERLPELPLGAPNQFTLHAGQGGALVSGLVSSDENPLYADENFNGIDDAFERQNNQGNLLAAKAPAADRAPLARRWQQDQQLRQIKPWPVQRPLPDGAQGAQQGGD